MGALLSFVAAPLAFVVARIRWRRVATAIEIDDGAARKVIDVPE